MMGWKIGEEAGEDDGLEDWGGGGRIWLGGRLGRRREKLMGGRLGRMREKMLGWKIGEEAGEDDGVEDWGGGRGR